MDLRWRPAAPSPRSGVFAIPEPAPGIQPIRLYSQAVIGLMRQAPSPFQPALRPVRPSTWLSIWSLRTGAEIMSVTGSCAIPPEPYSGSATAMQVFTLTYGLPVTPSRPTISLPAIVKPPGAMTTVTCPAPARKAMTAGLLSCALRPEWKMAGPSATACSPTRNGVGMGSSLANIPIYGSRAATASRLRSAVLNWPTTAT